MKPPTNEKEDDVLLDRMATVVRGLGRQMAKGLRAPRDHDLIGLVESAGLDLAWARRQILLHWSSNAFFESCDIKTLKLNEFLETCAQLEEIEGQIRSVHPQGMKEPALSFEALRLELGWLSRLAVFPKGHKDGDEGIWEEDERELRRLAANLRRWSGQLMSMSERFADFYGKPWWPTLLAHFNQRKPDLWGLMADLFHKLALATDAYSRLCNPGVTYPKMQRWRKEKTAFLKRQKFLDSCLPCLGGAWVYPRELQVWRRDIGPVIVLA
eukprot:CAMPEP_0178414446 /NCGR_PEP_ID=MMETSP0689_2-20121128/23040_1 /TAXON_ID=160604 /ORGANISM="Amphidinium massartii, Strain CS-259" /LENGTH=268 /DNA_ID=CAMNT_0020035735 /DNA_START=101 /DNA_END=904 /DNA_ORIENTATION=-